MIAPIGTMDWALFLLVVFSFGALAGVVAFAILDKIRRERQAHHKLRPRHFIHPFEQITDIRHHDRQRRR